MEQIENEELLRKIKILEYLIEGRNPFTNESLSSDSILNNIEVNRCLFTAIKIMREYPSLVAAPKSHHKRNWTPFSMTSEQKEKSVSLFPEKITAIRNNIRLVVGEEMEIPQAGKITQWLTNKGYLKISTELVPGKNSKIPTKEGETLGISANLVDSHDGGRFVQCIYSTSAQKFIIDNIEKILNDE